MAIINDKSIVAYPRHPTNVATTPTITTSTYRLNSATDYVCAVMEADRDMVINKIKFKTGTQTTGCAIQASIEVVSTTTGSANGVWATNTSGVIGGTSTANTEYEVTLTANATISRGDVFAVVLRVSSGTPSALNINAFADDGLQFFPYLVEFDGSVTVIAGTAPMFALSDATDGYIHQVSNMPANTFATFAFSSSSTPDVYGNKFTLETPKRVVGFWVWADVDQDTTARLLDTDGSTVLASKTIEVNFPPVATAGIHYRFFDTAVDLAAGTDYYLTFEPNSTANFTMYSQQTSANKYMGATFGGGDFVMVSAKNPTNAASYTVSTTEVLFAGLLLGGGSDGAGGQRSYGFA
jgi:hypothetical protein